MSEKKIARIQNEISESQERISNLEKSKQDIDLLSSDENNVYVLNKIDGGEHHVRKGDDGKIYIETSSDALSIHEITHIRQSLTNIGILQFRNNLLTNAGRSSDAKFAAMEVEAYQMQYSYDKSFPGNMRNLGLQGINVHSVGNIFNSKAGRYVYPVIRKYSIMLNDR